MENSLFFICPTDCLEPVINSSFKGENYFFTSLGNSVSFDVDTIFHIGHLIRKYDINRIYFVLSDNNSILKDALGRQNFSRIGEMADFYHEVCQVKKKSDASWQLYNKKYLMLSCFLKKRKEELQAKLNATANDLKISCRFYNEEHDLFTEMK